MKRTNFRLPLSDVRYDFASLKGLSTPFDTIVVGGGVSGAMIAGKLLNEKNNVLVIERGDNILRPSKYSDWTYAAPANVVANRALNKHFVHRRPQSVNPSAIDAILTAAKSSGFSVHPSSSGDRIDIQTPNVLGGAHCVLGQRSWFRGIASDWIKTAEMPFAYDPRVIQLLRRLESIPPPEVNRAKYFSGWVESQPTLRGKKGVFRLSRPGQFSEVFKPILEGMVSGGCELTTHWDTDTPPQTVGAGRINTIFVDNITSLGHSTLASYLSPHLEVQNSVLHECTVDSLVAGNQRTVAGVKVRDNDSGDTIEIPAKRVILAAGANESPRLLAPLLSNSKHVPGADGTMWTTPTVVLRYSINQPITLAPASNPVVRALAAEEWRRFGTGWLCSGFDDMTCFYNVAPDIARQKFRASYTSNNSNNKNTNTTSSDATASTTEPPTFSPYSPQVVSPNNSRSDSSVATNNNNSNGDLAYGINKTVGEPRWVRINAQPFMFDYSNGEFSSQHGFQLRISLCSPFSRGGLAPSSSSSSSNTAVVPDFKPFSDERDIESLRAAVEFATQAIFTGFPPDRGLIATPVDAEVVFDGPHGGGNLVNRVVDVGGDKGATFAVKDLENCFVADSSVHPHGQLADSHLFVMAATESMHETALGRKFGSLD